MPTYLITGANRGLGLEFVRQLSTGDNTVLACTRNPSSSQELHKLSSSKSARIHILECNISSPSSISSLHSSVQKVLGDDDDAQIDYLLNNAGINSTPSQQSLSLTSEALSEHINVNVLGPAKVVETLLPFLKKGSVVMNMTSGLGSVGKTIGEIKEQKCTAYAVSKAALNMLTAHQSFALKEKEVRVVCMDPGWVKTDMGGEGALLEPQESIAGMLKVLHGLGGEETAKFYQYDGQECPW